MSTKKEYTNPETRTVDPEYFKNDEDNFTVRLTDEAIQMSRAIERAGDGMHHFTEDARWLRQLKQVPTTRIRYHCAQVLNIIEDLMALEAAMEDLALFESSSCLVHIRDMCSSLCHLEDHMDLLIKQEDPRALEPFKRTCETIDVGLALVIEIDDCFNGKKEIHHNREVASEAL